MIIALNRITVNHTNGHNFWLKNERQNAKYTMRYEEVNLIFYPVYPVHFVNSEILNSGEQLTDFT